MFGFLIALGAGFLTPHLEAPLARPVIRALGRYLPIDQNEHRLVAFLIALLGAAVLASLIDSGSTFGIVIGTILGYFGLRLSNLLRDLANRAPRN